MASAAPLPHPRVEAGNAALKAQEEDLPDVRFFGANYMIYGVYQYWVHQNSVDHLDGGIVEDIKWQAQWEKLVCMPTQRCDATSGKVGKRFVGILSVELDRVRARKWNAERVIIFNLLSSNVQKSLLIPRKFESTFCFDSTCAIVENLTSS